MPHALIDYSANLARQMKEQGISALVHRTMIESGLFAPENLKTRAYPATDYHVGLKGSQGSFIHIRVYLLDGRSDEQKKELSEKLVAAIQALMPEVSQLTVDIRDMNRAHYSKHASA